MNAGPLPPSFQNLIKCLNRLPGVGLRNAQRMALALVQSRQPWPEELAQAVGEARQKIHSCVQCGFYAEEDQRCAICSELTRDFSTLCVVETANDILPIERAGVYRGLYHCLGGKLSPLDGIGPEQLSIQALLERVKQESINELILALGTDVEGETTCLYLVEQLRNFPIKISRPAQGLPLGGTLDLTDSLTLARALQDRKTI